MRSSILKTLLALITVCTSTAHAQLTAQQAKRIEAAVPAQARVKPQESRRVLIWNTPFMEKSPHKGYCIPQGEYAMKLLGERTGAFTPVVSDDVAMFLPENLRTIDAIIMNNSNGPWIRPREADMVKIQGLDSIDAAEEHLRQSLLNWISQGGGIVAYHHAIGGNTHWPAFLEMLGASYWGHPWNEEVGVRVDDSDHVLCTAFEGRDFRLAEEIFQFNDPYSRNKLRILLSLDVENSNMTVPWIHRKDNDFGLAWVRSYGQGRVFYCAIGHRTEIWWNPTILKFYLDGIQFACGDLAADTTPSSRFRSRPGPEFVNLFNGRDLSGWTGNPRIWIVHEGAITGRNTPENRVTENTFLIWTGGEVEDFELHAKFRLEGGNSGIYFHSRVRTDMHHEPLVGPQADFSADQRWTGVLMEYTLREVIAERGQRVQVDEDGKITEIGRTGDATELLKHVDLSRWNQYLIKSRQGHTTLSINGQLMCEAIDRDPNRPKRGKLALQVHRGPDMKVQFKDLYLRRY